MSEVDLSFVSTEDLEEELLNRVDHGVIVLMHIMEDVDGMSKYRVSRRWVGNSITCVGLSTAVSKSILQECLGDFIEEEESDEWS